MEQTPQQCGCQWEVENSLPHWLKLGGNYVTDLKPKPSKGLGVGMVSAVWLPQRGLHIDKCGLALQALACGSGSTLRDNTNDDKEARHKA